MVTIYRLHWDWSKIIIFFLLFFAGSGSLASERNIAPLKQIPDVFVSFEPGSGTKYAIVVEMNTQQLIFYTYDGSYREVNRMNSSTGKVPGSKSRSGDEKTPEGVYFFTREYIDRELAPIYGTRAFPMDYPNALDRHAGRNGNAIWLHGTNKSLKPRDTNGCIALENRNIDYLKKYIRLNQTPIVVTDKISYVSAETGNKEKKPILKLITEWNNAVERGTYHDYVGFYDPDYLPDLSWWMKWNKLRKANSDKPLGIESNNISILKHDDIYIAYFDQSIRVSDKTISIGRKKLFLIGNGKNLGIIAEENLPAPEKGKGPEKKESPLVVAYNRLITTPADTPASRPVREQKIAGLIEGWLRAWSSKDIKRYGVYYAEDFRSQKKLNLKQWLNYKNRLNRKYDYIKVSINNLKIKTGENRASAVFRQTYRTDSFKSTCSKRLIFKSVDGNWKIFREIAR